ncbi:MAG: DNA topoisomerase 4 subunit A [Clostridiales bacterium]|nr:DNA topoisomerase 4 subunit A [Clostridiales bacterium]
MPRNTNNYHTPLTENIIFKSLDEVMHNSVMPYAEYVILERALPRVEDGLKPVQRRILFSMLELGLTPDKPHRKSARIVGDCLGKYHPHGDSSVYDAMVRMAQPFNMSLPLVDGHGNFGSMDGDTAAAMRYTEARMTPAAMLLLRDLDKDTVPFGWNFDDTLKEPEVLPGRFPNLLVNGASGIAVGLATNIPPHNPTEAIDAVIAMIENPKIKLSELMAILPAPDFPTGGYLLASEEIQKSYETGRGKLTMRARTHFEEMKNGKTRIVITELPYQVNKARLLENILAVTQEKKAFFAGVADIRDESDRNGMRAVIEVKKDGDPEKILQYLFKYSDLQCTFGANYVAIAGGRPQQLSLKQILKTYIAFQREVVTRRTQYELETARRREHILEGLMVAVDHVDQVIRLIRASRSPKEARARLCQTFELSEIQAQAILDLRLQRLTNLELLSIEREYAEVVKRIADLTAILASERKLFNLIRRELLEIREMFPTPRRTQLVAGDKDIETPREEGELAEDVVVALCADNKVRRCPERLWNLSQVRADGPWQLLHVKSDAQLRLVTNLGEMLSLKVSDIPETRSTARAANLMSLVEFQKNERVVAVFAESAPLSASLPSSLGEGGKAEEYLQFTANGMVKRTAAAEFSVRAKRTAALTLKDKDELIAMIPASDAPILLLTQKGMGIRFDAATVPATGRTAAGVHGMKLDAGDKVLFAAQAGDEGELLCLTDRGFGKRSFLFDFELQGRNGKGLKAFDFKKNGLNGTRLVYAAVVTTPFSIQISQRHGTQTTLGTEQIHIEARAGKGTMLVPVVLDDEVTQACRILE